MTEKKYMVINTLTGKPLVWCGIHDDTRKTKLSMRNKTYQPWRHSYGIAEVEINIVPGTVQVVDPETNKWVPSEN